MTARILFQKWIHKVSLYKKEESVMLLKNSRASNLSYPGSTNSSMNLLYLVLNLLSAPNQLLISPQTCSTFLNFCFIYIFNAHSLQNSLILSPAFKNSIHSSCSSQKPPLHQIFIDPTDSNDPSWHFIEVSPMVEFILHCYVVICEFLVIMVTGTPATRLET